MYRISLQNMKYDPTSGLDFNEDIEADYCGPAILQWLDKWRHQVNKGDRIHVQGGRDGLMHMVYEAPHDKPQTPSNLKVC